jgi:hypothetical protein
MPLRRENLDNGRCPMCEKDPTLKHTHEAQRIWLHSRCHPSAGCRVSYFHGVLTVACRECKAKIADVAVAP